MAELDQTREVQPPRRQMVGRKSNLGLAVGFLLLVAGAGVFVWWRLQHPVVPPAPLPAVESPPTPVAQVPAEAEEPLPPAVANVDPEALLRQLAAGLSSNADLLGWLKEGKLIPRLTAAVNMVAAGENPHPLLTFLAPGGEFKAETRDGKLYAAAASHARYDAFTHAVTALDPQKTAAAYAQVAPFFQRAFKEIRRPGERFNATLHAAIARLLATPIPEAEPELKEKGAVYLFADDKLEALSPAQKQFLRLGAANARELQKWLAAFDRALPR